jgi:hypothetical protein
VAEARRDIGVFERHPDLPGPPRATTQRSHNGRGLQGDDDRESISDRGRLATTVSQGVGNRVSDDSQPVPARGSFCTRTAEHMDRTFRDVSRRTGPLWVTAAASRPGLAYAIRGRCAT